MGTVYPINADNVKITGTEFKANVLNFSVGEIGFPAIISTLATTTDIAVAIAINPLGNARIRLGGPLEVYPVMANPSVSVETEGTIIYNTMEHKFKFGGVDSWNAFADGAAKYILQTADDNLPNAQTLSALPSGIVTVTTGTGVLSSTLMPTVDSITINEFPVAGTDGVNKNYVQALIAGLEFIAPALLTTGTGTNLSATYLNGVAGVGATLTSTNLSVLIVDGITVAMNNRVLVSGQTSLLQNGVYYLSQVGNGIVPWILTRTTDYDETTEITPGTIVPITNGSAYAGSSWLQVDTVATIGTDPIQFIPFTSPLSANTGKVITFANTPYTVLSTDNIINVDSTLGEISIILPAASPTLAWKTYKIKDQGGMAATNNITISVTGVGGTIDGELTFVIANAYESTSVYNNGTAWFNS